MYVPASRKRFMAIRPTPTITDGFDAEDVSILSTHLLAPKISEWDYQEEPDRTIWCVRDDGALIGCTFMPEHDVVGWHRHDLGGAVESLAVIPNADESFDELWLVVRRTINGATRRYVERMVSPFDEETPVEDAWFVFSGIQYDGAPTSTITGLGHLEGETVAILADGMVLKQQVVPLTGSLTLSHTASKITVGLPSRSVLEPTDPDAGSPQGSTQGLRKRVVRASIDVIRSSRPTHGQTEDTQEFMDDGPPIVALGAAAPVYTGQMGGDKFCGEFADEIEYVLVHDNPLPITIRSLTLKYEVGNE